MSMTITLVWWAIPLAVTVLSLLWAFFWPVREAGIFDGIERLFMVIPALFISLLAWAIAGVLK